MGTTGTTGSTGTTGVSGVVAGCCPGSQIFFLTTTTSPLGRVSQTSAMQSSRK